MSELRLTAAQHPGQLVLGHAHRVPHILRQWPYRWWPLLPVLLVVVSVSESPVASEREVWVGVAVPGPDYPQRMEPVEVRVFTTREAASAWMVKYYPPNRANNAPEPRIYPRKVESRGE